MRFKRNFFFLRIPKLLRKMAAGSFGTLIASLTKYFINHTPFPTADECGHDLQARRDRGFFSYDKFLNSFFLLLPSRSWKAKEKKESRRDTDGREACTRESYTPRRRPTGEELCLHPCQRERENARSALGKEREKDGPPRARIKSSRDFVRH